MRVRVPVEVLEMLAVLVVVLLTSVTEGVVVDKCDLTKQMRLSLPPNVPDSEVARIVCYVQVTSGFNTSMVKDMNITWDKGDHPGVLLNHHDTSKDHGMAGQSNHQENDGEKGNHPGRRKSSTVGTHLIYSTKSPVSNLPNHDVTPKDHGMAGQTNHQENDGEKRNHPGRRKSRSVRSHLIYSTKSPVSNLPNHDVTPKDHGMAGQTNHQENDGEKRNHPGRRKSSTVGTHLIYSTKSPVSNLPNHDVTPKDHGTAGQTSHQENDGEKRNHPGGRKSRSARSHLIYSTKSPVSNLPNHHVTFKEHGMAGQTNHHENDGEKGNYPGHESKPTFKPPKPEFPPPKPLNVSVHVLNASMLNQTVHHETHEHSHEHNNSNSVNSTQTWSSKAFHGVWKLYGLFQLSDRVACVSDNKPSINLCGMSCNDLTNENITDDIACVGTIIKNMKSMENHSILYNEFIFQMYDLLQQGKCASVEDSQYLTGC